MKKGRRIVQRLLTTLLCLTLCTADIITTGMTVLAQEQEAQPGQEETDTAGNEEQMSEEEIEAEEPAEDEPPVKEGDDEITLPVEEEQEPASENPDQEKEEPDENDAPVIEDDDEAAPPAEEEQESVSENAVEDAMGVNSMMSASAGDIASGTYGNITWVIDAEGCLTIQGTGEYSDGSTPWWDYRNSIKTAKVNVTGIQRISSMFFHAENLVSVDLSGLDISQVTNMEHMFDGCSSLTELDLSNFNAEQVRNAYSMFDGCKNLSKIKTPCNLQEFVKYSEDEDDEYWVRQTPVALPAENDEIWIRPDGTGIAALPFDLSSSIEIVRNKIVGVLGENVAGGTYENITWVIDRNGKLTVNGIGEFSDRYEEDRAPWYAYRKFIKSAEINVTDITNISYMFFECSNLTSVDLADLNTANVTDMSSMFESCYNLENLDLSSFNTSNVTDMSSMFEDCYNLENLDLSSFDTGRVTRMYKMFYMMAEDAFSIYVYPKQEIGKLKRLDLSNFDTTQVTNMYGMFFGCESLESLDISNFKTDRVESMSRMFGRCFNLTSLDLSGFNTNNVKYMDMMFFACEKLEKLNVSSFNTGQVTHMEYMFDRCKSLADLDLSNFDTEKVTEMSDMLLGCSSLKKIKTPCHVTLPVMLYIDGNMFWYQPDGTEITELPKGLDASIEIIRREKVIVPGENIASGTYENVTWVIDDNGKLSVNGTGEFANASYENRTQYRTLWFNYRYFIKTAEIHLTDTTNASYMFYDCKNLESLDMTDFNTSKVTNMLSMFNNCNSLENLDFSGFDTSNVKNMDAMFLNCFRLKKLDLSSFDTNKVTQMTNMFCGCKGLTSLDISSFNMKHNMWFIIGFFNDCSSLRKIEAPCGLEDAITLPAQEGEVWMMPDGTEITELPKDLSESITLERKHTPEEDDPADFVSGKSGNISWEIDTNGKLTVIGSGDLTNETVNTPWYNYRELIKTAEVNVTSMTDASYMFYECENLTSIDLTKFDTSKVTDMRYMFSDCENLTELDVSKFSTGSVTDMGGMFFRCKNLTELDLSNFNTDSVTDMSQMFYDCENLTKLDVSSFDTSSVMDMSWMFESCNTLIKLDLSKFSTGSVTKMIGMFSNCSNLTELDVSGFNTGSVKNMSWMFQSCGVQTLDLSNFDVGSVTDMSDMFLIGCSKLTTIHTPRNVKQSVKLPSTSGDKWYLPDGTVVTELPRDLDYSVILIKNHNPNEGKPDTPDDDPKGDNDSDVLDEDIPEDGVIPKGLWISRIEDQTYTGAAIKPEVRVYEGETRLTQGIEYTLSYKNNTKAAQAGDDKPPTVVVKGKGNYSGTETKTFAITKCDISDTHVTKNFTDAYAPLANGKNPTLVFSAKYSNKALKKNTDYTLTVKDNAGNEVTSYWAEGTYLAVVKGIGSNYTGEYTFPFEVLNKIPVSKLKISKIAAVKYDGTSKTPEPVIKYGKVTLNKEMDYSLSYHDNTEIGTATVTVEGKGDYFGKRNVTFSITGLPIKQAKFTGFIKSFPYTGDKVYQNEAVLTYGEEKLVKDTDYTVSYSDCLNKGKVAVTYTGIGKYMGTIKKTYSITAFNIAENVGKRITLSKETISAAYTKGGARPSLKVYDGTRLLTEGKDYTLSYQNNTALTTSTAVKQPTITMKGKGNYVGTFSEKKMFTITAKDIAEVTVTVPDVAASTKIGKYKSTPVLTDTDGKKLKAGTDYDKTYTYTYKNTTEKIINNGTEVTRNADDPVEENDIIPANTFLCVHIKAKDGGNYTGEKTAEYRAATSLINRAKITVQNPAQNNANLFPYTGQAIRLEKSNLIVKVGTEVLSGDQYEILENTYKNNVSKGTASVQIRGVGNYGGTATVKFKIGTKKFLWF